MNAKGYYEEETGEVEDFSPVIEKQPETEAEKVRAWLAANLDRIPVNETVREKFYSYEVRIFRSEKGMLMLSARSPQAQQRRYSMGDCYARGTAQDVHNGLEVFIKRMEAKVAKRNAKKEAKRQARANFENPYKVGDILHSSWGYEQTNREFYQVLEVRPTSIKIREICQERNESHGWMSGTCSPIKDKFVKDKPAIWRSIQIDEQGRGWVNSPIYGGLYKYDGRPLDWSGCH